MGVQKVPHEIWFTRSLCVSIEPKLPYANEVHMKSKSENTQESPSASLERLVKKANRAFVRAEANCFALRGLSIDIRAEDLWFDTNQERLDTIIDCLERRNRRLGEYLREAYRLVGGEEE
jgi:hypothetical protein